MLLLLSPTRSVPSGVYPLPLTGASARLLGFLRPLYFIVLLLRGLRWWMDGMDGGVVPKTVSKRLTDGFSLGGSSLAAGGTWPADVAMPCIGIGT